MKVPKISKSNSLTLKQREEFFTMTDRAQEIIKLEGGKRSYAQRFSEPRKNGYRCKWWHCDPSLRVVKKINTLLKGTNFTTERLEFSNLSPWSGTSFILHYTKSVKK